MIPKRHHRLANFLDDLALEEEGTARVLAKMGRIADPSHGLLKSRLLREIADILRDGELPWRPERPSVPHAEAQDGDSPDPGPDPATDD